jgi:hypothetical protein
MSTIFPISRWGTFYNLSTVFRSPSMIPGTIFIDKFRLENFLVCDNPEPYESIRAIPRSPVRCRQKSCLVKLNGLTVQLDVR